jgi:hypothetical protein
MNRNKKKGKHDTHHSICMISDFFYPNMGGVEVNEMHGYI